MKKFVALLLGAAMSVTAVAGLAACKDPDDPKKPNDGDVKITRKADPRATDAYEAYDNTGKKVGAYKTIADAINATVEADKDYFEDDATADATPGGYVIKKGGTKHLFENRKGFASGNSDMFWYYEKGTELAAYNCWDNTYGVKNLHNQKVITHEVADMGLSSIQGWNGYGLLDEVGQEIPSTTLPPTWELSSPMDAGVIMFPTRKVGVTGLHYKMDMSKVQITPAYEGVEDDVYAYIGMYAWQDYYVISFGIACNTLTGEWYQFRGTSRDNSFSDTDYKVGEKIMDSTWNKEGGYWTPNVKTIEMTAKTVRKTDDAGKYWEDEIEIKLDSKTVAFSIDDETVNQFFAGNGVGAENAYMFIAGLDIKNKVASAPNVANVDYFNGAKFENLAVTEAEIYFPTEEEMTNVEYAIADINPELRGIWHDALMANSKYTEGTYDYTMLMNYACTSYEKKDGQDVYNFRFDGSPVSEKEIGGQLKVYQDAIDALKGVTVDTIDNFSEELKEIGEWYGDNAEHENSTILQQYYLLIDFAPYLHALDVLKESLALTPAAEAILTELNKLTPITAYEYKGWEAPAETAIAGYLFSELKVFRAQYALYNALTEASDKTNLVRLFGENSWTTWIKLSEDIAAVQATAGWAELTLTSFAKPMGTTKDTAFVGDAILNEIFYWGYAIKSGKEWSAFGEGLNDDGNGAHAKVMQFDTSTYPSLRVIEFVEFLEGEEIELPELLEDLLVAIGYESFYNGAWYPLSNMVTLGLHIEAGATILDLTEDEMEFLNTVWTKDYKLDGHISWNWISGHQFADYMDGRGDRIITLMGGDKTKHMRGYVSIIADFLKGYGYEIRQDTNGWGTTAEVINNEPDDSAAAKAVVTSFKALSDLSAYTYKGWTTTEANKAGYLYSEIEAFRAVVTAYDALTMNEQLYFNIEINAAAYRAWLTLSTEMKAIEDSAVWSENYKMLEKPYGNFEMKNYTAAEALAEIIHVAYVIKTDGRLSGAGDDGESSKVINGDANFYTSLRLMGFYHFYKSNDVELPEFVKALLTQVGCDNFYNNFFYPLYYTVQIAQSITDNNYEDATDLTEDELAFLNEVWTSRYTMKEPLATHYNTSPAFKWWSERVTYLVAIAGGKISGLTLKGYIDIVADFLEGANYTLNNNGWGVTASAILNVPVTQDSLAVIELFKALSSLNPYVAKGWAAPEETAMAGYLYSESKYFMETVKVAYDALTDSEKETVRAFVGETNFTDWADLAKEVVALNADEEFMALTFKTTSRDGASIVTYSAGDALAEFFMGVKLIAAGTKWNAWGATNAEAYGWANDDPNGGRVKDMNSDNNWMPSLRIIYLWKQFNAAEVEIPEVIAAAYNGLTASSGFMSDVEYLFAVLTIAKMLETDANLALTQEIVDLVNATMVGRTGFTEGGLVWNWNGTNTARDKNFIAMFGLDKSVALGTYITNVINYLVANGATATSPSKGETKMGITEAISLPAAE